MKYKNTNAILPKDLIEKLEQYVQGEYIYIHIKDKGEKWGDNRQFAPDLDWKITTEFFLRDFWVVIYIYHM